MAGGSKQLVLISVNPLVAAPQASRKALALLQQYEQHPQIATQKRVVRNACPPSINLLDYLGQNLLNLSLSDGERIYIEQQLSEEFIAGGKPSFEDIHALYLLYDVIVDPECMEENPVEPRAFLANKAQLSQVLADYGHDVLGIVFPFNISQNQLIEWIKNNWANIEKEKANLPQFTPDYVPKNIELGQAIIDLKRQGLTFEQIADQLHTLYPDDEKTADANQIKLIYHRTKKFVEQGLADTNKLKKLQSIIKHTSVDVTD